MSDFISLLEFLTNNLGAVAAIAIIFLSVPIIIILALIKIISKMQHTIDDKIDNIENSTITLAEHNKTSLELIKWMISNGYAKGESSEGGENNNVG